MSHDQKLPATYEERAELTLPPFGSRPPIVMDISKIREGEKRLIEAKVVNGATYSELEYTYNEGYREAKKYLSVIGYELTRAQKALRDAKSEFLLDRYPEELKKIELKDSVSLREAFLEKEPNYVAAQDRIDMLKAIESLLEGKIKVFENVCRYMKKQIDIENRSGTNNHYTGR